MGWKKTKIGKFLFEREGRFKPDDKSLLNLDRLEKIDFSGNFYIGQKASRTDMILIKKGDFVISGINVSKGAMGIYRQDHDITATIHYSSYTFDESKIDINYFEHFLQSSEFVKLLEAQVKGGIKTEIKAKHLLNIEIVLPSPEQQKRIAEKLKLNEEKQKNLQLQINQQKTNLKNLRKQILQDAIEGKLTKEWREKNPDIEPASELLKKIKKEKEKLISEKKIKKEKPLPEISKSEIPFELPESWVWTRLGNITNFISGNNFDSNDFSKGVGVKCIKITNAGVGELIETNDVLPQEFLEKHNSFLIYEGDLILALTRPYILDGLKISLCSKTYDKSLLNQRVAAIRSLFNDCVETKYIYSFLRTNFVLMIYKSMFEGKGQQPNLKKSDVTDLLFSFPPFTEQIAIVSKLQTLMQKLDEVEKQIEKNLTFSKQLSKAILAEAFNQNNLEKK